MKKIKLLTALPLFVVLSFTPAGFAQDQGQYPSQSQEQDQSQSPSQDQQQTPPSDQQQTPPSGQTQEHDTTQMPLDQSISGELKSVDTDAKKLVVTTADGTDMEFVYNESTQCGGAQDTIEGLATSSGSQVTVHYKDENQQKIATRIEVQPASQMEETPQVSPTQPGDDTPSSPDTQDPNPPDANRPPDNPEQPLPQQQPE